MLSDEKRLSIERKSSELRASLLRLIAAAGTGHPGSSLSCVEILAALYYGTAGVNAARSLPQRDMVVLSKGHAVPALYAILLDKNVISISADEKLRAFRSQLQGHPDARFTTGIDASTGSLGQGLSVGLGYVLGCRTNGVDRRAFVILGDGECQEGQVWEAALIAAAQKAGGLYAIVDYNKLQHDGPLSGIVPLEPLADKWRAFGWRVLQVDGHDLSQLDEALRPSGDSRPTAIIAHTVKGKGVPYMENDWHWHSVADAQRMKRDFAAETIDA